MYNIARITDAEREILFRNTAEKKNMSEGIVEKDFWVTVTLDYLFHKSRWKDKLAFKGGTSLSKAYNLVERFSEDIDLILDWRVLGYEKDEPWKERSNTKQDIFFEEANERAADFLSKKFVPVFKADIEKILDREIKVYIDPNNSQIVNFEYPCLFTEPYILRMIRLEIGALAAWTPVERKRIRSYASEVYENAFLQSETDILTTSAERSFWEKVTILHREAYRAADKQMPASGWLVVAEDEGLDIPKATRQAVVNRSEEDFLSLIQVDTILYRAATDTKAVRKNVSLPRWMANLADKRGVNCSQLLQESLMKKLRA